MGVSNSVLFGNSVAPSCLHTKSLASGHTHVVKFGPSTLWLWLWLADHPVQAHWPQPQSTAPLVPDTPQHCPYPSRTNTPCKWEQGRPKTYSLNRQKTKHPVVKHLQTAKGEQMCMWAQQQRWEWRGATLNLRQPSKKNALPLLAFLVSFGLIITYTPNKPPNNQHFATHPNYVNSKHLHTLGW
jgi:hypothetical protein